MSKVVDKLDEVGAQGVQFLSDFTTRGVQFIEEQAPLLCSEIVWLGVVQYAFIAAVFLVFLIISLVWLVIGWRWLDRGYDNCKDGEEEGAMIVFGAAIPSVTLFLSSVFMFYNAYHAVCIAVAPRVYLLEYFAELAGKATGG